MNNNRQTDMSRLITACYERLSRDDELQGDSNSIINQKRLLEDYAASHGFGNCVHYTDDGISGGTFERPAWKRMLNDIEAGNVGCVLAKDMSRIGRDYLQTGFYTEVLFRERGVRFIAIGNGVDSADKTTSEFAPFLNIMNEWYLRDCSRKQCAAYQARGKAGKPTTKTNDEAGYFDLGPLDHGESTRREICLNLEQMGYEIEASHHEVAQGQHEIDFKYAPALECADKIMTFKLAVKIIAQRTALLQ